MKESEYNPDYVTVVEADGKENVFEEVDRIATDTGKYIALLPVSGEAGTATEEDDELIILKVEDENGEIYLAPIEDDEEFEEIASLFEERLSEMFDFDTEE